jgi:hypothetical protein
MLFYGRRVALFSPAVFTVDKKVIRAWSSCSPIKSTKESNNVPGTLQDDVSMQSSRDEDAVSEVIGEVLIVALVVVLAAIIGAMVFGVVGKMPQSKVVGVSATRFNNTNISVTYSGGGSDAGNLLGLNISVNGIYIKTMRGPIPLDPGNTTLVPGPSPGKDRLIVTGNFSDGNELVVLEATL